MKVIMVMYDTLRRDFLPGYGKLCMNLPNFRRLADHSAVFECSYAASLPCMPARRDIQTGRAGFLHRSWGPLEPYDDSMPALITAAGIRTHLATDHFHYLQDGGATYHSRYQTWNCFRGQENDPWMPESEERTTEFAPCVMSGGNLQGQMRQMRADGGWQNMANRAARRRGKADYAQSLTFDSGIDFIRKNAERDSFFLQIETFDPHEPFDAPQSLMDPDQADWPPYARVQESAAQIKAMREKYKASVSFCDENLGRVLDIMDQYDLWKDTMLIVNTDHGFFLGEHSWWGKGVMPDYEELVHTPLYIWDPRAKVCGGQRTALVQTIDLAPTILDFLGMAIPDSMTGRPLGRTIADDTPVRKYGILGYFGGPLTVTDGRYLLMKAVTHPENPCYEYTQMPTHLNRLFSVREMQSMTIAPPLSFTKGTSLMKIRPDFVANERKLDRDLLFDLQTDPYQMAPVKNEGISAQLQQALLAMLKEYEAPQELYMRYDF